jgi:hypothetical protein
MAGRKFFGQVENRIQAEELEEVTLPKAVQLDMFASDLVKVYRFKPYDLLIYMFQQGLCEVRVTPDAGNLLNERVDLDKAKGFVRNLINNDGEED